MVIGEVKPFSEERTWDALADGRMVLFRKEGGTTGEGLVVKSSRVRDMDRV